MSGTRVSTRLLLGSVALLALLAGCGPDATQTQTPARPQGPPSIWVELSQIVIQFKGAAGAPAEITRTKEEALQLAAEISDKIRAGADYAELARQHSDDTNSASNGGILGTFHTNNMEPEIAAACTRLAEGGVSDPVESKYGFHVIRRDRDVEMALVRHILISHVGSKGVTAHPDRTKDEARARALEALEHVRSGVDFADVAVEYSDDPNAVTGGELEPFPRGIGNAELNAAAFALEVGQISDVTETMYGFHVIHRLE